MGSGGTARPREDKRRSRVAAVSWVCYYKNVFKIHLDIIITTTEEHRIIRIRMYIYTLRMIQLQPQTPVYSRLLLYVVGTQVVIPAICCCSCCMIDCARKYFTYYEYIVCSLNENQSVLLYVCTYAYACVRTRCFCCFWLHAAYSSVVVCCRCWIQTSCSSRSCDLMQQQ